MCVKPRTVSCTGLSPKSRNFFLIWSSMKTAHKKELISVVMPVYNAGAFVVEAVNSILNQTYRNFEFIIVDDASTDGSWRMLQKLAKGDKRIVLLRNGRNLGVSSTVKKAIKLTKGKYIARMDADDVCYPRRLEKQLAYLKENRDVVAVGSQCDVIDKSGRLTGVKTFPEEHYDIYRYIFTLIPIQQPTMMIARSRLPKDFAYYIDGMNTAEEIELIFKLFKFGKLANLDETLLAYRIHDKNISLQDVRRTFFLTLIARFRGVIFHGYRPSLSGIMVTLLEALAVAILPRSVVIWLYNEVRSLFRTTWLEDAPALKARISPAVS